MAFWSKKTPEEKAASDLESARRKSERQAARALTAEDWGEGVSYFSKVVREEISGGAKNAEEGGAPRVAHLSIALAMLKKTNRSNGAYQRYLLSQVPADDLADVCRMGAVPFTLALSSKAAAAPVSELQAFMERAQDALDAKALNAALRYAVIVQSVTQHVGGHDYDAHYETYTFGDAAQNADALIQKGARTDGANADLLLRAVNQKNPDLVRALVEGGANLMEAGVKAMRRAEEMKDEKADIIAQYLKGKLERSAHTVMADDQTLVVTKKLDALGGQLKLVFNFEARRVTEIFTTYAMGERVPQAAMLSHRFEDYDAEALKTAFDALVALGGRPRPVQSTVADKQLRPSVHVPRK